jgi:hypothetical protein
MVNGYTATEVGDKIIAKLVEPYENVLSILDWNIQAGWSNEFTVGNLTFSENMEIVSGIGTNLDLNQGDIILAGGHEFEVLETPDQFTVILSQPSHVNLNNVPFHIKTNSWNNFSYEWRWSQNPENQGGELSEWHPLNRTNLVGDLLGLNPDPTIPLWLEIRCTVEQIQPLHELHFLSITYTIEYFDGTIEECPQICLECEPFQLEGCANILVDCDSANLYNPYGLQKPAHIYKSLSSLANSVYGHKVIYYRVEPNTRSKDVILKEYSLYDVIEKASIKLLVPGNEFPTESSTFDIFGMGFEDFEVHLLGEEFRKHFGEGKSPRSRDYLYFPFNNRMYEVNGVSLADEFNRELTYFKLMLKKYENRTSTEKGQFEDDLKDLVVGTEELFGEEVEEETKKVTKPQQYQSTHHRAQDGVRQFVHKDLLIKDIDLKNRWTVISRNFYDLSSVLDDEFQAPAVVYEQNSRLEIDQNISFTYWFRPHSNWNANNPKTFDIIDGTNTLGNGLIVKMNPSTIDVVINDESYEFLHGMLLSNAYWYAVVINCSNTYGEVSCSIYKLDSQNNYLDPGGVNDLPQMYHENLDLLKQLAWESDVNWSIRGGLLDLTNIRILSKTVEQEQHVPVLHQYVLRDAQLSLVTDNAIPSLQLQVYKSNR